MLAMIFYDVYVKNPKQQILTIKSVPIRDRNHERIRLQCAIQVNFACSMNNHTSK